MDDLISKLSEIEMLCNEARSESDDVEYAANDIEGQAKHLTRCALEAQSKISDAECLLEEVKQAVGKLQGADPYPQAIAPDEAEELGFAVYRNGGENKHYCIDLPQDKRGDEWPVISIKMGDVLMTVAPLPTVIGNHWEPGDGWRGADVKIHGKQSVLVHGQSPFELTSRSSRQTVKVDGTVGVTAILAPDKQ